MIKKSRKILTLLLASLLIISSMSALSVSADAVSFTVTSNSEVITSTDNTAEYTFTNENETGWYELKVTAAAGADNGTSANAKMLHLTATVDKASGDGSDAASWTASWAINTSNAGPTPGCYYLEEGEEYTLDLSYVFAGLETAQYTISSITFTKQEAIEVSGENATLIHANDHLNFSGYRTNNYKEAMWESNSGYRGAYDGTTLQFAVTKAGAYGIWKVNVPAEAYYDVYAIEASRTTESPKMTLSVNDEVVADSVAAACGGLASSKLTATKLGTVKLSQGIQDLKLETSKTMYLAGIKLVPVYETLSATATTAIDAADFVGGTVVTNGSGTATGVIEDSHTYIGIASNSEQVYYSVKSETAQKYSISFVSSRPYSQTFQITNLRTNDVISKALPQTSGTWASYEHTIGEMTLPAGVSTLKVEATSGSKRFIYEIRFTPVVENTFSAGEATVVQTGDYEEVSVPINFTGSANVCGFQVNVSYDEDVEYVSYENGDILVGSLAVGKNGIAYANISGSDVAIANGTLATLKFNVPTQRANEFAITVTVSRVEQANGTEAAIVITEDFLAEDGVIKVVSPIKFTNGTTEVNDVAVGGTMTLEVDLSDGSNDDKTMIMFAIYSKSGDYAVLEGSAQATTAAGKATATIDTSDLTSGVNYYAKAFVWNGTTFYGFSQTIGE